MDRLMSYHSVDIQWGNHDVLWMGAASGHPACIANVIRISARYGNLNTLEDDYGINLMPLANFANTVYGDDPCSLFAIKHVEREDYSISQVEEEVEVKMHKAIGNHPSFKTGKGPADDAPTGIPYGGQTFTG